MIQIIFFYKIKIEHFVKISRLFLTIYILGWNMAKITGTAARVDKVKHRRKGIHSKSKTSSLKTSKHYIKAYRGQGR